MDQENIQQEEQKVERRVLPKTAFDSEYMTEFLREMRFLASRGIKYTFVRKTPDYQITQFKYKKTPTLFAALVEFYAMIEAEKAMKKRTVSPEDLKKAQEVLELAVQQGVVEKKEEDDTL